MITRILVGFCLVTLGAGFIFFAANVIWLGTKEFFKIYRPKNKSISIEDIHAENNSENDK